MRWIWLSAMSLPTLASAGLFSRAIAFDLDQLRNGLANDGAVHCLPTSVMNLFGHAGANGYPGLKVGHLNHAGITGRIQKLGTYMGVGQGGATMEGAYGGGLKYLAEYDPANFWVSFAVGPNVGLRFSDVAGMFRLGALVAFGYGRYTRPTTTAKWTRQGGHMVTMTGFDDAANSKLQIHDPGTDEGEVPLRLFQNSDMAKHLDEAKDAVIPVSSGASRRVIRYYRPIETNNALNLVGIDAMLVYWPVPVATIDPLRPSNLVLRWPKNVLNVGGSFIPNVRRYEAGGEIADFAFVPGLPYLAYLIKGSSKLFLLNLATNLVQQVGGLVNPRRLATGGQDASIFVVDSSGVARIHPVTLALARFATKTFIDAIVYDSVARRLVAFLNSSRRLLFLDENLKLVANLSAPTPASWPAGNTTILARSRAQAISDSVQRIELNIALARAGSSILRRLQQQEGSIDTTLKASDVTVPGLAKATGVGMDPRGRIVASIDQKLATFELAGGSATSLFNNLASRGAVAFPESVSAFDARLEIQENWRHVLPGSTRK